MKKRYHAGQHPDAWWKLFQKQKDMLLELRLGGMFGGQSAVGIGRAPYFWGQEYGNKKALITATHNARTAWNEFKRMAGKTVKETQKEILKG